MNILLNNASIKRRLCNLVQRSADIAMKSGLIAAERRSEFIFSGLILRYIVYIVIYNFKIYIYSVEYIVYNIMILYIVTF